MNTSEAVTRDRHEYLLAELRAATLDCGLLRLLGVRQEQEAAG
jgi:hypothetical protein